MPDYMRSVAGRPVWVVDTEVYRVGPCSIGVDPAVARVEGVAQYATVYMSEAFGTQDVSFWMKTGAGDSAVDRMRFYIDGVVKATQVVGTDWEKFTFELEEGLHTLTWELAIGGYSAKAAPRAWVDSLSWHMDVSSSSSSSLLNYSSISSSSHSSASSASSPSSGSSSSSSVYEFGVADGGVPVADDGEQVFDH